MDKLFIKGPDRRVIACPRALTKDIDIGTDNPRTVVDESKLKAGWVVFDPTEKKKGA